jgi:hypothetical protein
MSETPKELKIRRYNYRDTEYVVVYNSDGNLVKRFHYKENAKTFSSINKTKYANEETIRKYYQSKSDVPYKPTTKTEYKKQFEKFEHNKIQSPHEKVFKNKNRLLFRKDKRIQNFDYMYINVRVKIYFDGVYSISSGRSNYYYGKQISDSEERQALQQAIRRAIAPYGYSVKYELLNWNYAYHQIKYTDFDK